MTTLREAAQQALEALYEETAWFGPTPKGAAAIAALRTALAQERVEPVACPCGNRRVDQCPGEWESGCDLGSNAKYARRAVQEPQTIDEAMRLPRAMAQAYEAGYNAGAAVERKRIIQFLQEMQRQVGDGHNYYGVAAMRIREME